MIEMQRLKPLIADQLRLERQLAVLREESALITAKKQRKPELDERINALRSTYRSLEAELKEALSLVPVAERLEGLTSREDEARGALASVKARLERDEQFQKEIKNGFCPVLSEKCLNLRDGQTLEGFISHKSDEYRIEISRLEERRRSLSSEIATSRNAALKTARISEIERQQEVVKKDGLRYRQERDDAERAAERAETLAEEISAIESELAKLDNPKGRVTYLERISEGEPLLRSKLSEIERRLATVEGERRDIAIRIEAFSDLEHQLAEWTQLRDASAEAYRTFLVYQAAGKAVPERESAFKDAETALKNAERELDLAQSSLAELDRSYSSESHTAFKSELAIAERRAAETAVRLENASRRYREIELERQRLARVRESLQSEIRERDRLETVLETTAFIRDTLKEAAPLVARNYVYRVSVEANQLFREVTGDAERTLKWSHDYSVLLEEGGYDRPFQSLSGGEQMAAALSIRLALLRQLSDIRIAFFDEPTTNMDAERRENLAMQIGQITHFDQLFVISHDDTFEGYMDNEVRIERDDGQDDGQ
jgi:exonuclease SbcC